MDKDEPGDVRVRALVALVRELSPLNERHTEVKRELNIDEAEIQAEEELAKGDDDSYSPQNLPL